MQGTKSGPRVIPRIVRVSGTLNFSPCPAERPRQGIFEREYLQYQTLLEVSYMEIYKDEVCDLVTRENASTSHSLDISAHINKEQAPT